MNTYQKAIDALNSIEQAAQRLAGLYPKNQSDAIHAHNVKEFEKVAAKLINLVEHYDN